MEINLWLILLQTLPFAAAIFLLNKIAYKPVMAYLAERERNIDGYERDAKLLVEDVEAKENELERELDEVRAAANAAKTDILARAAKEEDAMISAANKEAEAKIDAAAERIAGEKAEAMQSLEDEARSLADRVAGSVLGRPLASLLFVGFLLAMGGDAMAAAEAEGGSHGPDWYFIAAHAANLLIFLGIVYYFGRRPIGDFLKNRKAEVGQGLERAKVMKADAEARNKALEQRVAGMADEKEALLARAREVATKTKEGRMERAERGVAAIHDGAARAISEEEHRAQTSVQLAVADRALELATDRIRTELGDEDETRLWEETLASVSGSMQ